jgi:hypothetical protein
MPQTYYHARLPASLIRQREGGDSEEGRPDDLFSPEVNLRPSWVAVIESNLAPERKYP